MVKCKEITIRTFEEQEGNLAVIEKEFDIDIDIKRVFYIYGLKENAVRGQHANRNTKFIMVAINGSCEVIVDNGFGQNNFILNSPTRGLFLENMTWKTMHSFTKDCVLMVIADTVYNKDEYIYNYEEFLRSVKGQ